MQVIPTQVEEGGEVVITGDNLRLLLDYAQLGRPTHSNFYCQGCGSGSEIILPPRSGSREKKLKNNNTKSARKWVPVVIVILLKL